MEIHSWRADGWIFKLLLPISHARLYLALLHLHRATWTCIKTIPIPSFDAHCLVQQQIIICLTGKITADKCKWAFFQLQMHENIFGTFYGYIAHLMETFMTASSLGISKISSSNFTIFINSTLILNVHSNLEIFFPEYQRWVCDLFGMLSQIAKKEIHPWSYVGLIKSKRRWYVMCMCVCANCCARESQGRERCLDLVWTQERLLVIAFLCWPSPLLLRIPPNNWNLFLF